MKWPRVCRERGCRERTRDWIESGSGEGWARQEL